MRTLLRSALVLSLLALGLFPAATAAQEVAADTIPLPEHPRPDFERDAWLNLNGTWDFRFDSTDVGTGEAWYSGEADFPEEILVPFPWGSALSGVEDEAEIAWYRREIMVPEDWNGERIFLVVGAADWETTAWLDGQELGTHQGGYTPFAFELTEHATPGTAQRLVFRVDDQERAFKLEGKQGYGNARGIWQTVYLEARGETPLATLHFTPDLADSSVLVEAALLEPAPADLTLDLSFLTGDVPEVSQDVPQGTDSVSFSVPIPDVHLWSLDDPFLYEVEATLGGDTLQADQIKTYFGMRDVGVVDLPGTDIPYIALNGEPVYVELALDQAYHPEGFYTFPSDEFIRDEVLMARQIGLNGLRVHVKIAHPRKLYWADRLGMLIMADVPNSWGEPTDSMRHEVEYALREMVRRDYNHPSIFAWVPFNETWGLKSENDEGNLTVYTPETQEWVASVVRLAQRLDSTRLVEDNSPCCGYGHTETDINSWHAYLPGWEWKSHLDMISDSTFEGSTWNFEKGYRQGRQPNINSEFGNVWGYEGSAGDVDWSWDYHLAVNSFRRHPKIAGWLYTEHHDVINEWNGYWRYDRSEKETGMGALVEGMSLRDLHAPLYVAVGDPEHLALGVEPGADVQVPLWASFLSGSEAYGDSLTLHFELYGWDTFGEKATHFTDARTIAYEPWMSQALDTLALTMPAEPGVFVLDVRLEDETGAVQHRNFTTFVAEGQPEGETMVAGRPARVVRVAPGEFAEAEWSEKQWDVLDGLKVNGAGAGFFEYRMPWPDGLDPTGVQAAAFLVEASAKQLFDKDRDDAGEMSGDYMRGRGTASPHRNPNAYPMTDETDYPSAVTVTANGHSAGRHDLADDPADHRGILSWYSQQRDGRLREPGSYGELLQVPIPRAALEQAAETGELILRLEVDEALPGGLAIYGQKFGRYPLDPTLVFMLNAEQARP